MASKRCYPLGRYSVSAGLVSDGATGLTWQQAVSPQLLSWSDAATYCSSQAGGFRLPTLRELQSIVDYTKAAPSPTINSVAFPNTPAAAFWTSTTVSGAPGLVWEVFFDVGSTNYVGATVTNNVRCVRTSP